MAVATVVMAVLVYASSASAAGSITEYRAGLQPESEPTRLVDGPEGNVWFTDSNGAIGRITPSGTIAEFSVGNGSGSQPHDITVGPEGNLWFTERPVDFHGTAAIGRITPSGMVTEFTAAEDEHGNPISLSEPLEIVSGPDGNLWFTDWAYLGGQPAIGRVTPSGQITEFKLPQFSIPRSIIVGPDGNLWFTNRGRSANVQAIGKITPSGVITEYPLPSHSGVDIETGGEIVSGPGGALWFADLNDGTIDKITTGGTITEYSAGLQAEARPREILVGPEGDLWFTDLGNRGGADVGTLTGKVGRITPSGAITEYGQHLSPNSIAVGPDGNIWMGEYRGAVTRVTPSGQLTPFWLGLVVEEDARPVGVIAGPGGDGIWFGDSGYTGVERTGAIGKVGPVGPVGTTPTPTLEVELTEAEFGRVTSSPAGISCPGICSSSFPVGTEVTLTATADPNDLVFDDHLGVLGEEPCPSHVPPLESPTAMCHYTVSGDALYRVLFSGEEGGEEEAGGGGSPSPGGGGDQGSGESAAVPTTPTPNPTPSTTVAPPKAKPKPLKCRKGFKKQKKHGTMKCVKVKQKKHRH